MVRLAAGHQDSMERVCDMGMLATDPNPTEAARAIALAHGWKSLLEPARGCLESDPIRAVCILAGMADVGTVKPGADRMEVLRALRDLGVHPIAVALGLHPGAAGRWRQAQSACQGLAKRLGVPFNTVLVDDGRDTAQRFRTDQGGNLYVLKSTSALGGCTWGGWPDGLRVVPGSCYVGDGSKGYSVNVKVPQGVVIGGAFSLQGCRVDALPSGVKVGCWASFLDAQWDGVIPDDMEVGGGIMMDDTLKHLGKRIVALDAWRQIQALRVPLLATGAKEHEIWTMLRDNPGLVGIG